MYNEGVQFIFENNLLNHLLTTHEMSQDYPTEEWLTQTVKQFYHGAINISYVPYHMDKHLTELVRIFEKKSSSRAMTYQSALPIGQPLG